MPVHLATNPTGAFGESAFIGLVYVVATNTNGSAGGTIAVNDLVAWDVVSGAWAPVTNEITLPTTSPTQSLVFGVAMDTIAANATGRVATAGTIQAIIDSGHVTAGYLINASTVTAGRAAASASSTAVGNFMGVSLVTQATTGGLFYMNVGKL